MRWTKDPKVEANLRRLGVHFDVEASIPMPKIDREEGMRRQVRLSGRLNDEVVFRYATAMEDPQAAFPMPILQKEKNRYWPWSGNHRLASADLSGVQTVDAYVVQVFDPVMADLLPRAVNLWEAVAGMSKEEAIINAKFMIDKHGMAVGDAAKMFGLKKDQIYVFNRAAEAKQTVEKLGVPTNGFTTTLLNKLSAIRNQNAMREVAAVIHEHKLRGKEAETICVDVSRRETESLQLAELKRWRDALELRRRPKKSKASIAAPHKEANRERLLRYLTGLARYCETVKSASQAQILDPAHQQIVLALWKKIRVGITSILEGA